MIESLYSSGGCCDIYLSNLDGVTIATKKINQIYKNNQYAKNLMSREITFLRQINCDSIPKILWFNQEQTEFSYQFIKGKSLDRIIKEEDEQTIDSEFFLNSMTEILEYLESIAIVHGDLVPENIIYDRDVNKFYLIDFGAAFLVAEGGTPFTIGRRDWFQNLLDECQGKMERIDRKAVNYIASFILI